MPSQQLNGETPGGSRLWTAAHAAYPAAQLNRRFTQSPIDALIHLVVRCRLCRKIPVWLDLGALTYLRTTVIPQRRATRRGYVRWLGHHPDVVQYLPDVCAMRDERDDAHLPVVFRREQDPKSPGEVGGDSDLPALLRSRPHVASPHNGVDSGALNRL